MRKLIPTWFGVAAIIATTVSILSTSCGKEDEVEPIVTISSSDVDYFSNVMNFDQQAGEKSVTFTSNVDWSIYVDQGSSNSNWCAVSPSSGTAGENTIIISVAENTSFDNRDAIIILNAKEKNYKIVVNQNGQTIDTSPVVLFSESTKVIEGNNITLVSDNNFVATVEGNIIKGNHVGETIVTVNDRYKIPVTVMPFYHIMDDPITEWGVSLATVKSKQTQGTLYTEDQNKLIYQNCGDAKQIGYLFENDALKAVLVYVSTSYMSAFTSYLQERYAFYPGQYSGGYYFGFNSYSKETATTVIAYRVESANYLSCTYMSADQDPTEEPYDAPNATGSGTLTDPYNSVAANNIASALGSGGMTSEAYYIKGKVVSVKEQFSARYGNASFYISDDGTTAGQFYIFRALYLGNQKWTSGNSQIKAGDEVVVYAKLTNYLGNTPETAQGDCYIYSINGKTEDNGTGASTLADFTNGDFETWADGQPTGWKSASTASNATLSQSTDAHGGTYSVKVGGATSDNKRMAYKELALEAGTYAISFYAKAATADGGCVRSGYVPIKADGSVGNYSVYGASVNDLTPNEWTKVNYEFTLAEKTTVCLAVMNSKNPGKDILIDDYSIIKK